MGNCSKDLESNFGRRNKDLLGRDIVTDANYEFENYFEKYC